MKIPYLKNSKYDVSGYDQVHPIDVKPKDSLINLIVLITILTVTILIVHGLKSNDWVLLQATGGFILAFWCWRIFISLTNTTIVFLGEAILALLMLAIIVLCAIYEVQYLFFYC